MATVDTSFYNRNPLKSVFDYQEQIDQGRLRNQVIQGNALAFQDRQRAIEEANAVRNSLSTLSPTATMNDRIQKALSTNTPTGIKQADAWQKAESERVTAQATADKTKMDVSAKQIEATGSVARFVMENPTPENAAAAIDYLAFSGVLNPEQAAQAKAQIGNDPMQIRSGAEMLYRSALSAKDQLPKIDSTTTNQVEVTRGIDPVNMAETPISVTRKVAGPDALLSAGERQADRASREEQARLDRTQRAAEPAKDTRPVVTEIVDPTDPTKLIKVDAVTNRKIGDAGKQPLVGVNLSQKDIQKREATYPKATAAVKQFEKTTNTFVEDLEKLRDHPGLNSITGIAAGRIPGITADGRAAQALFDKVSAKGGFSELNDMRQSSPTGGALGQVSNAEGQFLRAAFAEIDRKQDAKDVREAINRAIEKVKAARQNINDAYEMTYEYRGEPKEAKPATRPPLDSFNR